MFMMIFKGYQTQFPLHFPFFTGIYRSLFYDSDSKNVDFHRFGIRSSIRGNPEGSWRCSTVLLCEGVVSESAQMTWFCAQA